MNGKKTEDGAFTGYVLRGLDQALARVEQRQADHGARLAKLEKKIDALGSGASAAEIKQAIDAINAETAKVQEATATLAGVTEQLDKTGVS